MADNKIELKSIAELLGMKFFIPGYQRGYRWTEQQVIDLLNDIAEFQEKNTVHTDFYCLQPLVVKECIDNEDDFLNELPNINKDETVEGEDILKQTRKAIANHTKWEVIDGQQRLTTLFLILSYLSTSDLFSITYETRNAFTDFFSYISNIEKLNEETVNTVLSQCVNVNKEYDNIDYYHILTSFATIKSWFSDKGINLSAFKNTFIVTLLNRVKFIWYESVEEDPITVFTRLNIGKISLTNAELIKALFLNLSRFPNIDKISLKLKQQEIASEWDMIEYTLQNDEFWLFLHKIGYNRPTRIDFIFDLICEQNAMNLPDKTFNAIGSDGYKTFRYFYEYFKPSYALEQDAMHDSKQKTKIELCWSEVKKYFQTFQEWFDDLEIYHYVGALLSDDFATEISDIFKVWTSCNSKKEFINTLKGIISEKIKIPKEKYFCDKNHIEDSLHYNKDKKLIRKILLIHNIQTIIIQNRQMIENKKYELPVFYKFPFNHFKKETWNVEHIDSNTSNDLTDLKQQKEWLQTAWIVVKDENLKNRITSFIINKSSEGFDDLFQEIIKEHDSKDRLKEGERMLIWNLALLDEATNKGYHNAIFPLKRRILIGKDQGVEIVPEIKDNTIILERNPIAISFIPICTKNAFLKYYTSTPNDLMIWSKADAEAYLTNIIETIEDFKTKKK